MIDSLELKGRCQRDFNLLGISLRSINNIAKKSGEAYMVVIFKQFGRNSGWREAGKIKELYYSYYTLVTQKQ